MKCNCLCHILPSSKPNKCKCCLRCPYCKRKLITNYKLEETYNSFCYLRLYTNDYHNIILKERGYDIDNWNLESEKYSIHPHKQEINK